MGSLGVKQTGSLKSSDEELPRCTFGSAGQTITEKIVQSPQSAHLIVAMALMELPLQSRWVHKRKEMLGV